MRIYIVSRRVFSYVVIFLASKREPIKGIISANLNYQQSRKSRVFTSVPAFCYSRDMILVQLMLQIEKTIIKC